MTDDFASALDKIAAASNASPADVAAFPQIKDRYWEVPAQDVQPAAEAPALDRSERLEKLLDMSLDKAEELLNLPVDQLDENYTKVAGMQKDLVVSILNTGVKVDENRFKKRSAEALTAVLTQIAAAEQRGLGIAAPAPAPPGPLLSST